MNKLYSVHDHWTDINKKNDVDIESIGGVITGIKVNGEDYGGVSWTKVFSGDVVTSGEAAPFSGTINAVLSGADTIKVFYNDTEYILDVQPIGPNVFYYGATVGASPQEIDFSTYPFVIIQNVGGNLLLYTQAPGPQDITILEPQSGGGSSDFSTAEVEFKNQTTKPLTIQCCCIIGNNIQNPTFPLKAAHNQTYTVVLYKGSQQIHIPVGVELAKATGDITVDDEESAIIINGSGSVLLQP